MRTLLDIEKGYICGMLDGEGTITITKHRQYNQKNTKPVQYRCFFTISNTCKEALEKIKKMLGVGSVVKNHVNNTGTINYIFRLSNHKDILEVLTAIIDFLYIKQKQAKIAITFINSRLKGKIMNGGKVYLPYNTIEVSLHKKIKELNTHKGVFYGSTP